MSLWDTMVNLSPTAKIATSLIAKDVVGCVMYTSTARNNKQYTPEKRADVANYDLANGIINIALQILAIKPIESAMTKFSDSKLVKTCLTGFEQKLKQSNNKTAISLLKYKKGFVDGSVALFSTIICQYFIKRFIAPYISMPASQKFQEWGLIKPKLYEGETYDKKQKLNVMK